MGRKGNFGEKVKKGPGKKTKKQKAPDFADFEENNDGMVKITCFYKFIYI